MSQENTSTQIVLVQDHDYLTNRLVDIADALFPENPDALIAFENRFGLTDILKESRSKKQAPPKLYLLDVGGCGHVSADKILADHQEHYANHPMPTIIYLSLERHNAVVESVKLMAKCPDVVFGFSSVSEVDTIHHHLYPETIPSKTIPASDGLRIFLNETFDTDFPLTINEYNQRDDMESLKQAKQSNIFSRLSNKEITTAQAIDLARNDAMMHANMAMQGLFTLDDRLDYDERFHVGTKMSAMGPAIFSPSDIEKYTQGDKKPILITRQYTPALARLVSDQKIAGVITTGTYLAAHMGLICDSYNVAGLFGHAKDKASLREGFEEAVKGKRGNFYKNQTTISLGDHTIRKGQDVAIVNKEYKKGLIVNPNKIKELHQQALSSDKKNKVTAYSQSTELKNAFARYFGRKSLRVELNISRDDCPYLEGNHDVGLVRTEHIAQNNVKQFVALKQYILSPSPKTLEALTIQMQISYQKIFDSASFLRRTRFRLFDLNIKELFNQGELEEFQQVYGSINDIKGMDALTIWPDLYEAQMNIICNLSQVARGDSAKTIEVMMPNLKSAQDVQHVKNIYDKAFQERKNNSTKATFKFGTMIENRALLKDRDELMKICDFFSFGTNDLTQDITGIKRGDITAREAYKKQHGFDPFIVAPRELLLIIKDFCHVTRYTHAVTVCGDHATDIKSAARMLACGVDGFSVAPNARNLYALPTLAHYHLYDRLVAQEQAKENARKAKKINKKQSPSPA